MWVAFKEVIFEILKAIYGFVGDWGMAIITLTVLVRLLLIPLTLKQTKSMYELQRIQPKVKELQKKYANDKEKLQEETLKFYQENKVNPFGGCLPILLQMPIFLALYGVLGNAGKGKPGVLLQYLAEHDLVGRFYFLIPDVAKTPKAVFADGGIIAVIPYAILVIIFGLSIWLPQALMPGEKQQKMIGLYMAVVMLFFGWSSPAGVLLYWDVSSLWTVAQQQIMMKSMKARDEHQATEIAVQDPVVAEKAKPSSQGKRKGKKKKSQG